MTLFLSSLSGTGQPAEALTAFWSRRSTNRIPDVLIPLSVSENEMGGEAKSTLAALTTDSALQFDELPVFFRLHGGPPIRMHRQIVQSKQSAVVDDAGRPLTRPTSEPFSSRPFA